MFLPISIGKIGSATVVGMMILAGGAFAGLSDIGVARQDDDTPHATAFEIEPIADSCRLTVIHDQLPPDAAPDLYGGWPMLLSGLKTWLETGTTLTTPGSLMYGPDQTEETTP